MARLTTSLRRAGRVEHALRATMALAGADAEHPRKLGELLERSPGPEKFLAMILGRLRQQGIVASTRGSRGGYWLTRSPAEITVLDVVEALGPEDGAGGDDGEEAGTDPPTVAALWDAVDDRVRDLLGSVTLADLAAAPAAV